MVEYDDYVKKLKNVEFAFNDQENLRRVEARLVRRRHQFELAFSGAALLLVIGLFLIHAQPAFPSGQELLSEDVFQQSELNGNPVMNYLFSD